jgi:hypothetical protein
MASLTLLTIYLISLADSAIRKREDKEMRKEKEREERETERDIERQRET